MSEEKEFEYVRKVENETGEEVFEYRPKESSNSQLWKHKLMFWGLVIGGIAIGTVLFLFFITVLIYVVLPLAVLFFIWSALKNWKMR